MTVTKTQWLMVFDERTEMKWYTFFDTKNGMLDYVCCQFHKCKGADMPVKILICENAGKNKILEK